MSLFDVLFIMNIQINSNIIELATKTAEMGGIIALEKQEEVSSMKKADSSIVTEADKKVERKITRKLQENSEYDVIGEEYGGNTNKSEYWIIDPIDGTRNYSLGQPIFATSIALVRDNSPVACAVNFPALNKTFYAEENEGAYLNNKRISVRNKEYGGYNMIGLARRDKNRLYNSLKNNFSKIQIPKGAVYSACSVAAGWTDGAILTGLQPWDVASGVILIREAGGEVENLNLKSNKWSNICNKGFYWNSESTIKNEILSTFNDSEIEYV